MGHLATRAQGVAACLLADCLPADLRVQEHAYWTSYRNVRADYVSNFYDVINWKGVSQAYMSYFTTGFDVLQPGPLA